MIKPKKLIWQIFPANILTVLIAIVAVSWYGTTSFSEFYLQKTESDLEARANLLAANIADLLPEMRIPELRDYCIDAGRASGTRITVITGDGTVIADSNESPEVMDNHSLRPEIHKAFSGQLGSSRRYSKTLDENLIYVAIPLSNESYRLTGKKNSNEVMAVLRTSVSVATLDRTMSQITLRIVLGALLVMVLAGVITLLISRNVSRPLEQMTRSAEQFSRGDFGGRMLSVSKKSASFEVVTLAASMDRMAAQLDEKIQAIVTHRNQLETVFSSMVEAVIAVDAEEKIISINSAAACLFDVEMQEAVGKLVQQVVRNISLQQQITSTLESSVSQEDEIILQDEGGERFLQTNIVPLSNGMGENVGGLLVINDVTRIRRLENVRKDFVANVSHELRTPITSIKGYVETLLDGAMDIREDTEKFLQIVLRQSERLTSIIDDLLLLSRIEEGTRMGDESLVLKPLLPVIDAAVQTCQLKADEAGVTLKVECPENLAVYMNDTLLEQALVNLLVNGIAYTPKGGHVKVQGLYDSRHPENGVRVLVQDSGCGIAREHLDRLFERFYRIDKARSRDHGGTGLGLAIVKHIAQTHNGRVEVASVLGKGSEFTLILSGGV